jgi:transglutaminase-like putative cysteine protease
MSKRWLPVIAFLAASTMAVAASDTDGGRDLDTRIKRYDVTYTIQPDGAYSEDREWALVILKDRAVANAKQASISYSTSIQKAEIKAAYTLKPDGRRIDAPKTNFQVETNTGHERNAPVFSDRTTTTVVFPEVAAGDTVVLAYRLTASEPMFPKQFSTSETFWRSQAYDSVDVKIDAPESLQARYEARQMKEVRNVVEHGRRRLEWTFENPNPPKDKRSDWSVIDTDTQPGFAFSTFRTYQDIAEAYGIGARPKAVLTPGVQALAQEIAGTQTDPREIARLMYEWVAVNLSYAGNCVGLGAVVPHDTDFVIANRMGDCKDHATLLQALLAAKGIASTQALINAGSTYALPKIPVASTVNHVIVYIPSLDLYADATSDSTPFGMLPFSDRGKPVLIVDGGTPDAHTPAQAVGSNRQTMKTVVHVQPDGSIKGTSEVSLEGTYAVSARSAFRDMSRESEEDLMKNYFQGQGYIGSGTLDRDDAKALLAKYRYGTTFEVKDKLNVPGPGAFKVEPIAFSQHPISSFLGVAVADIEAEGEHDTTCTSGTSIEEYDYVFPRGMKMLATPDDVKVAEGVQSYTATYKLHGDTLTVRRVFEDHTTGVVCSSAAIRAQKAFARKVVQDQRAQIVYK